ncbi:hypothetical protein [Marispirochaeta aestuarii]|uniref:hypothetical protein n=1 Tax=Marispirochaeta aestuarii TaxID=1963862 RepID=UPI0029C6F334|nr:hypothetical protein [Marispirochaeta aestuarii]
MSIGIGRIESGILFVPVSPLWYHGDVPWELQTGVTLSYSLATNDKEYESFLLHSMRINLPLLAAAELRNGQSIVLGGGVSMQFDILNQDRQYYGSYSAFSAAPGVFVEAAYRYRLNDSGNLDFVPPLSLPFFLYFRAMSLPGCTDYTSLRLWNHQSTGGINEKGMPAALRAYFVCRLL